MFAYIKSLFQKDLSKIKSAFSTVEDDLIALKDRLKKDINKHSATIGAATVLHNAAVAEHEEADKVHKEVISLVG